MLKLNPYLSFNGEARAAFEFYAKVLRGQIVMMLTNAETPMRDQVPAAAQNRIAHTRLVIGDQMLMASDAPGDMKVETRGTMVSLVVDTVEEAERIYKELGEGGQVTMPMAETFWARRFGMFNDKFGIPWMVNCEKPM
ncbi:VOC family protein [Dongia sp.]|uniref:VOC family protein n=1 Tax=Dongia sp. TaxID=1977262 RepID=UPI0035B3C976